MLEFSVRTDLCKTQESPLCISHLRPARTCSTGSKLNAFSKGHIRPRVDANAEAPRRPKVERIPYLGLGERAKWVLEGSCDTLPVPFLRRLAGKHADWIKTLRT